MIRTLGVAALISVAAMLPPAPATAQDGLAGALLGGAAGALIGGAATGRAGGAIAGGIIGGTAGAIIGSRAERRGEFYWYQGRCYREYYDGYERVPHRFCY